MESLMSLRLSGSGPRSRAAINLQVPSYFFKISYYYFDFFFGRKTRMLAQENGMRSYMCDSPRDSDESKAFSGVHSKQLPHERIKLNYAIHVLDIIRNKMIT